MKLQNYKNLFIGLNKRIKEFDFNSFLEEIKNLNIDDFKNINYKRLFYDIRNSQYFKPTIGIFSASIITILILYETTVKNIFQVYSFIINPAL